jgi:hypothetical protein
MVLMFQTSKQYWYMFFESLECQNTIVTCFFRVSSAQTLAGSAFYTTTIFVISIGID